MKSSLGSEELASIPGSANYPSKVKYSFWDWGGRIDVSTADVACQLFSLCILIQMNSAVDLLHSHISPVAGSRLSVKVTFVQSAAFALCWVLSLGNKFCLITITFYQILACVNILSLSRMHEVLFIMAVQYFCSRLISASSFSLPITQEMPTFRLWTHRCWA